MQVATWPLLPASLAWVCFSWWFCSSQGGSAPEQPSCTLGFFNSPRVQRSKYSLPRSPLRYCGGYGEQASRLEDPEHGIGPESSSWEHSLATEDSVPQQSGHDQVRDCLPPRWGLLGTGTKQTKHYLVCTGPEVRSFLTGGRRASPRLVGGCGVVRLWHPRCYLSKS